VFAELYRAWIWPDPLILERRLEQRRCSPGHVSCPPDRSDSGSWRPSPASAASLLKAALSKGPAPSSARAKRVRSEVRAVYGDRHTRSRAESRCKLGAGADDCVSSPAGVCHATARATALLPRAEVSAGSDGLAGECRADRQGAAALVRGAPLGLVQLAPMTRGFSRLGPESSRAAGTHASVPVGVSGSKRRDTHAIGRDSRDQLCGRPEISVRRRCRPSR
jgi:hypothetical protein